MSGMEADDLDDSLCGGAKCDRENSDCAQLESRNRDKTKVTVNVLSYYISECKTFCWPGYVNIWASWLEQILYDFFLLW